MEDCEITIEDNLEDEGWDSNQAEGGCHNGVDPEKVVLDLGVNVLSCKTTQNRMAIYQICPYTSACPNHANRCTCPCSKKHITSNSHQMPDKTSKDHPKH